MSLFAWERAAEQRRIEGNTRGKRKGKATRRVGHSEEVDGNEGEEEEEEEEDDIERVIFAADRAMADAAGDQENYDEPGTMVMSVSEKVTRGALIRKKVEGGCPLEIKKVQFG